MGVVEGEKPTRCIMTIHLRYTTPKLAEVKSTVFKDAGIVSAKSAPRVCAAIINYHSGKLPAKILVYISMICGMRSILAGIKSVISF